MTDKPKAPAALQIFTEVIQDALNDYITMAEDGEDQFDLENTPPEERVKDFIRYLSVTREIDLTKI